MGRTASVTAAICVASAVTCLGQDDRFGIVTQILNPQHARWASELGTGHVRVAFNWEQIEPRRGQFDWSATDAWLTEARARRLGIYATLGHTPAWAGPSPNRLPGDLADWRNFVRACMLRYGSDIVYGIWNEPNLRTFLEDDAVGSAYKALWREANAARLTVSDRYALAGPETSHHAMGKYFDSVMAYMSGPGGMLPHDKVTVHWYPDGPRLGRYMRNVHRRADPHEIWLTEVGKASCDDADQEKVFRQVLAEFTRPGRPWWTSVFFYVLHTSDACSEAILRPDWQPRRAFEFYRTFIAAQPSG